jgi:hypothetical protein
MKRFFAFVLILAFLALAVIFIPGLNPATAEQVDVYEGNQLVKSVVFKIGVSEYVVDDQMPGVKMDVAPFVENDRTFVPVRFLGNALGVTDDRINWDNNTQTATLKGNATLQMTIGKAQIASDGQVKAIDVAPVLLSDRTFLPARFVAEGLGYQVDWDDATQTVVCWPAGETKPDVSAAVDYLNAQEQPVVQGETYTTRAGYQIPKETKLVIANNIDELGPGNVNRCELDFGIDLTKGDLEGQWKDATAILSQKLDSQVVDEVMAYVKQKTDWNQKLLNRFWETTDKKVCVGSSWGSYGIQITVWYKS